MKRLFALIAALLAGCALTTTLAHAKPSPPVTMILVGGHGDASGDGIEYALRANGFIPKAASQARIVKIAYLADATRGDQSTADATPKIVAAYNTYCLSGARCELQGVSLGTNPVIRASNQLALPNASTKVVLHASPNPLTGAWHSLNNQSFVDAFDPYSASFTVKEFPRPGMEHWYHQDDYVANKAPQCFNDSAILYMATVFGSRHVVQPKNAAHDVWTGPEGVINHEFGGAVSPLTVSGKSAVKPTCPDPWYRSGSSQSSQ
jgi:hypothetical protein